MHRRKTILILNYNGYYQTSARIEGVRRFAREAGWNLEFTESGPGVANIGSLIEFWHADGCIVNGMVRSGNMKRPLLPKVPVVFVDAAPDEMPLSANIVYSDAGSIVGMAAKELLRTGYENYAFASTPCHFYWSDARREEFRRALGMKGAKMLEIRGEFVSTCGRSAIRRLTGDIVALPKPVAIFAANDLVARGIIHVAVKAGLRVPGDIAIVGADNDPETCESDNIGLSSVIIDFRDGGYRAASMLAEIIANPKLTGLRATYGAIGVYRRASTPVMKRGNPLVIKALAYIRDHIAEGITADDVADAIGCSRRTAYYRFKEMTGMTIHEAITKIRLETISAIRQTDPHVSREMLATMVGLKSTASLWRITRRQ